MMYDPEQKASAQRVQNERTSLLHQKSQKHQMEFHVVGGKRERRCKMITLPVANSLATSDDGIARLDHLTGLSEEPEVNHPFPDVPYVKGIQQCIVGVKPPQLWNY